MKSKVKIGTCLLCEKRQIFHNEYQYCIYCYYLCTHKYSLIRSIVDKPKLIMYLHNIYRDEIEAWINDSK
jgi:hypothetical protein